MDISVLANVHSSNTNKKGREGGEDGILIREREMYESSNDRLHWY